MIFDNPLVADARPIAFLKRAILVFVVAFLLIGIISSHRAYYQVRNLKLTSADRILHSGSVIQSSVVTSGRTNVDLQIELIQGMHSETLAERRVPGNEYGFFDPRTQHASVTVVITPEIMARFQSGPAKVRATAFGHSQWTRVPPPVVQEVSVEIQSIGARVSEPPAVAGGWILSTDYADYTDWSLCAPASRPVRTACSSGRVDVPNMRPRGLSVGHVDPVVTAPGSDLPSRLQSV